MKSVFCKLFAALALLVGTTSAMAAPPGFSSRPESSGPTVTAPTTPTRPATLPPATMSLSRSEVSAPSEVTLEKANEIFRIMAGQSDIAFKYVKDGCYARAHLMIERIQRMGVNPVRVWTFANGSEPLFVRTTLEPSGSVSWSYHVAPALAVRQNDGKLVYMVIDPSMFKSPVTVAQWSGAQKRSATSVSPIVRLTKLGEAPILANGLRAEGSGYWPGRDPVGGVNTHALATMRDYKAREPRF